jgi:hypothetical protein
VLVVDVVDVVVLVVDVVPVRLVDVAVLVVDVVFVRVVDVAVLVVDVVFVRLVDVVVLVVDVVVVVVNLISTLRPMACDIAEATASLRANWTFFETSSGGVDTEVSRITVTFGASCTIGATAKPSFLKAFWSLVMFAILVINVFASGPFGTVTLTENAAAKRLPCPICCVVLTATRLMDTEFADATAVLTLSTETVRFNTYTAATSYMTWAAMLSMLVPVAFANALLYSSTSKSTGSSSSIAYTNTTSTSLLVVVVLLVDVVITVLVRKHRH